MSADGLYPNPEQMASLEKYGKVVVIKNYNKKLNELIELQEDAEEKILAVDPDAFDWNMDSESVKNIPNVVAVCTQSNSYDWVKPKILSELGVKVLNCGGFSTDAVAEYAVCMTMEIARHLPLIIKNDWKIDWSTKKPMLLKGKKLGIVGLGKIGKRIAEIGKGIGMEVSYWSRNTRDESFNYSSLEDLFKNSDVIIPALSENEETQKIISNDLIDTIKQTSYLVGLNRIKVLWDEDYIIKKVEEEKIAGYVFEGDNGKPVDNYKGNILALPSMAWYAQDSLDNLLEVWVENMVSVAKGKPQNIVN